MRVLIISANTERISMVTLALGASLVAGAAERAGHEVSFLDLLFAKDPAGAVRDAIASAKPEVIGISVRNIDDQNRQEPQFLLEKVREVTAGCRAGSAAPIVLGGAGYGIYPRAMLDYLGADFGIRGDGEEAFPALLQRLQEGRDPRDIPGVYVVGDPTDGGLAVVENLDDLPLWNDLLSARTAPAPGLCVPIQTRRGCPNDCSYCSTARIQGRPIRCASPIAAAETLAHLAEQGFRHFHIVDNCFNLPEPHAFELCRRIRERDLGITWRCILYPHLVKEELVDAMREAGCTEVSLGFESGCAPVLKALNKRFLPRDVRLVADRLAARGIQRMGFLLLGAPGETRESVEESLTFVRSLELEELMITVGIRIYPHTALARRAVREGVIAPDDDLLRPRFYLAPGLEPWIHERVAEFTESAT